MWQITRRLTLVYTDQSSMDWKKGVRYLPYLKVYKIIFILIFIVYIFFIHGLLLL